jgi:hypothetical protein
LRARVALLEVLMRIKDARMRLIPAAKRPHYVLASTDFRRNLNSPSATQSRSGCPPEHS